LGTWNRFLLLLGVCGSGATLRAGYESEDPQAPLLQVWSLEICVSIPWPEKPLGPAQSPPHGRHFLERLPMLYSPLIKIMPSSLNHCWICASARTSPYWDFRHRAGDEPAAPRVSNLSSSRRRHLPTGAAREQQTRTLAGVLYGAGSRIVWVVALLTAVREFDIDITAR